MVDNIVDMLIILKKNQKTWQQCWVVNCELNKCMFWGKYVLAFVLPIYVMFWFFDFLKVIAKIFTNAMIQFMWKEKGKYIESRRIFVTPNLRLWFPCGVLKILIKHY